MAKTYRIRATSYDRRGRKIATATNTYDKTHPLQAQYADQAGMSHKVYLHDEIACLIKSRHRKVHRVSIERYDSQGRPRLAKPCPVCELALRAAGVVTVEYTVGEPE